MPLSNPPDASSEPVCSPPVAGLSLRAARRSAWHASPTGCVLALWVAIVIAWRLSPLADAHASLAGALAIPTAAAVVLVAWGAVWSRRLGIRARRAWRLVAVGFVANLVGDVAAWSAGTVDPMARQSVGADFAHLAFYPCLIAGLLLLPLGLGDARARRRFALDAATITVGCGLVLWYCVAGRGMPSRDGGAWFTIPVAFPFLDVLGLVGIARVLRCRNSGPMRRALDILAFGLVLQLALHALRVVDLGSGVVRGGALCDAIRQSSLLLLALGTDLAMRRLAHHGDVPVSSSADGFGFLPYLCVMAGYGVLALGFGTSPVARLGSTGIAAGAVLLTGLVLARQLCFARDFAALRAEEASRSSEIRFRSLVQFASDAIVVLGADENVVYASPSADRIFRVDAERMIGRPLAELLDLCDPGDLRAILDEARALPAKHTPPLAWSFRCEEGERVRLESTATDLTADGHVRGIVLNTRDVSDRHALEVQLTHQAFHDGLTGLPNRALFRDRVDHALSRAWRSSHRVAVLFVDLDHFKTVNDSVGHDQGDRLLVSAAQRLGTCLRAGDTAARLGGDEFGVLLEGVKDVEQVHAVCQRITVALRAPFALDEREATISASVGVAMAVAGDDAEVLLRNADVAMYHAKESGRGRHEVFEASMHANALARLDLREALEHAVERGEMDVRYQPMVDLSTGETMGVEALCRWTRAGTGPVSPSTFIPLAEQTGQIVAIGRFVLDRACRDARCWLDQMDASRPFSVTVNLSVRQLREEGLVEEVARSLAASRLPASCLVLELTESVLAEDSDGILGLLTNLKMLGVRLAIDDFGTGYSSLSYLRRFPIDILKVAKSFVDDIRETGEGEALAKAILSMAANLSLDTVAEGIETRVQAEKLRELGCRLGQGFLWAPAIASSEIPARFGVMAAAPTG